MAIIEGQEVGLTRSSTIWDTVALILLVIVAAYVTALAYERGYAGYFGVPPQFVGVNLNIWGVAYTGVVGLFFFIGFLAASWPKSWPDYLQQRLAAGFVVPVILAIILISVGASWKAWVAVLVLVTANIGIAFLRLRNHRTRGEASLESFDTEETGALWRAKQRFDRMPATYSMLFAIILVFAYSTGQASAKHQNNFQVLDTQPACAVVHEYGAILICAVYDDKARKLLPQFQLLSTQHSALLFRQENIGPFERILPERGRRTPANVPVESH